MAEQDVARRRGQESSRYLNRLQMQNLFKENLLCTVRASRRGSAYSTFGRLAAFPAFLEGLAPRNDSQWLP